MFLQALHLHQFRNLPHLSVEDWGERNVILGDNAQGKTNLLEAIYVLSHTRSWRTSQERDFLWQGAEGEASTDGTRLHASLERNGVFQGRFEVEARFLKQTPPQGGKVRVQTQCFLNKQPLSTRSQLLGKLATVTFTVDELALLRGSPASRRQWLNAALLQWKPSALPFGQQYKRLLAQKSLLLKTGRFGSDTHALLGIYNQQLAPLLAAGLLQRLQYLWQLSPLFDGFYQGLVEGREATPRLSYHAALLSKDVPPRLEEAVKLTASELETLYHHKLSQVMGQEEQRGQCLLGLHRDDWQLWLTPQQEAHRFASQGQQRSIVLALKLAELALLQQELGEAPILLLDDVLAELDVQRQQALLANIPNEAQLFLTTPSLQFLESWQQQQAHLPLRCYRMEAGQLSLFEG